MRRWIGGALCALTLATACSGGGSSEEADAPSTTSSTTSTSTTTTTTTSSTTSTTTTAAPEPTDEELIVEAVRAYWAAIVKINNPPDPDAETLSQVAGEELAALIRENVRANLAKGEGLRLPEETTDQVLAVEILTVTASGAAVDVCLRDDAERYDLTTGELINDTVVYAWLQNDLILDDDHWVVTDVRLVDDSLGEEDCVDAF